jgi:hypothetical protein
MCHKLDPVFFKKLAEKDCDEVCMRSLAEYDSDRNVYRVTALGNEYYVNPEAHEIKPSSSIIQEVSVDLGLLILIYLLEAKDIPVSGEWVSEFNLRGGSMFFRGPHAFPVDEIASRFGYDMEGFKETCISLGGKPLSLGDAAFKFQVLPRVPVAAVLWYADDEFDASAKLLMDATIEQHLPLDVIFGMSLEVIGRVVDKILWGN